MPIIEIKSWINDNVLHTIEADSVRAAVMSLIKQNANLRYANLSGLKFGDLSCLTELSDAIDIAPMIFKDWQERGINKAQDRFGLHKVENEDKALIAMCPRLVGGFAFILARREIWWWQWSCPNLETVPVLWRESDHQ